MSWCERRRLLILLPLALVACGFAPVYAPGGTGTALRGRVAVDPPTTQDEYLLVRDLEDRLGRAAQPEYRLALTLSTRTEGQALTVTNETTRYSIVGRVEFALTRIATGQKVASGRIGNFTGYSATGTTVETEAGERDARARLMSILADQVTERLHATADLGG